MSVLWGGCERVSRGLEAGCPLHSHCVSSGVELGKPTHFTVSAKAAGKGQLDVQFSGPAKGDAVRDVDIIDHHDNTYTVKYTPVQQVATLAPTAVLHPLSPWASVHGGWVGCSGGPSPLFSSPMWQRADMEGWVWGRKARVSLAVLPSKPKWGSHRSGRPGS